MGQKFSALIVLLAGMVFVGAMVMEPLNQMVHQDAAEVPLNMPFNSRCLECGNMATRHNETQTYECRHCGAGGMAYQGIDEPAAKLGFRKKLADGSIVDSDRPFAPGTRTPEPPVENRKSTGE